MKNETIDSFTNKLKAKTGSLYPSIATEDSFLRQSKAAASFDAVVALALAYDEVLGEYPNNGTNLTDALNQTLSELKFNGLAVSRPLSLHFIP